MTTTRNQTDNHKAMARRLRQALAVRDVTISHSAALELVAQQFGKRDWNTLSAELANRETPATGGAPFAVGQPVRGSFTGKPASGRVIGLTETIKPDLWRVTVKFEPPVDVVTSELFSSERHRVTMVIGADGRSRRLTGTETGVMALKTA